MNREPSRSRGTPKLAVKSKLAMAIALSFPLVVMADAVNASHVDTDGKDGQQAIANGGTAEGATTLPLIVVSANKTKDKKDEGYIAEKSTTATKTNTLLRDVPQSISVVTKDIIKDQAIQSMADSVRYVPGMGISQGEGNRDALVFRGNRSTADFFVDGVRDDVQYYRDLYNIERVEVLKGPNGMIFGRGGSGGVINRVAKEAGWNPVQEISAQAGSFNTKRMAFDVGQGVNETVAVRLNAMYEDSGSYRDGVDLKRFGINPTATIMPSDKTKIVLSAEYFKDERVADRGIPSLAGSGRPYNTDVSTFFGDPSRSPTNSELKAANALVEHSFTDDIKLRNRTRFSSQDKFYQNVYADGAVSKDFADKVKLGAYNDTTSRNSFFNQTDLLFSLNTGDVKHDMVVGMEIGHQETDNMRNTGTFGTTPQYVFASNPITTDSISFTTKSVDNHSVTKQLSFYAQDQIKLLPELQAILGLRFDKYDIDFHKKVATTLDASVSDNLLSPRVGLVYKPIETVSLYSSYSLAYVPRMGEQLTSITVTNQALEPEKFKNIGVGAKWDIRPGLALTTALFQLERTNVITTDPTQAAISVIGGEQRNRGFELGLAGQVTQAWSVMGGYTYQDGVITKALDSSVQAGTVLAELPKNTFSLWNRYDFAPGWGVGLGVINRGAMYTSTSNAVRLPGFTRVDAAVYAKIDKNVRAQLNIENLFDTKYYSSAHNDNNITPGSPVAARLSIIANF